MDCCTQERVLVGNTREVLAEITDPDNSGALYDPPVVLAYAELPDGSQQTLTVVRLSQGEYEVTVRFTMPGLWVVHVADSTNLLASTFNEPIRFFARVNY